MGLDQFKADLAEARKATFPGVVNIRRGDSDGEFTLKCTHQSLENPLEIQILARDVSSYPRASQFMVFTASDDVEKNASDFVERIYAWVQGKRVQQIAAAISDKLSNSTLEAAPDSDYDLASDDELDHLDDLSDMESTEAFDSYDDEDIGMFGSTRPKAHHASSSTRIDPDRLRRLRKDLIAAKNAGIKVGILPRIKNGSCEFISLSIRISKLGIPHDSLEAWGLKASEYAVLLLKFPDTYPTIGQFIRSSASYPEVQFRFGKSDSSKPSLHSTRVAFTSGDQAQSVEGDITVDGTNSPEANFSALHVSKSIDSLLNDHLCQLFRIRMTKELKCIGWDQAQAYMYQVIEAGHSRDIRVEMNKLPENQKDSDGPIITDTTSLSLRRDYMTVDEEDLSLPLVFMQFALRRLARCTQYCMNCHRKITGDFEAVKPELCPRALCQFQYLSLGLGVGIEFDIIHNPFVVDLLVSFFYSSVDARKIRSLPCGLSLKNYRTGFVCDWNTYTRADICLRPGLMKLTPGPGLLYEPKQGDLVVAILSPSIPSGNAVDLQGLEKHICRIVKMHGNNCTLEMRPQETLINSLEINSLPCSMAKNSRDNETHAANDWEGVFLFEYHQDLDDLREDQGSKAFLCMADGIPSVLQMRAYLQDNPGRQLGSWDGIHESSLALLNWIVASNRSLIVQDDAVPTLETPSPDNATPDIPNRVRGMDRHWMQFRFAQGAREKEQHFSDALSRELPVGSKPATRFAWHGSPLSSWHSIIRTGLDFRDTRHGRAFGNGVYFSREITTSMGYLRSEGKTWPNAELKVSSAISLCEIVNKPSKFISTNPHYVVDKINWIQCRYLFVEVHPSAEAISYPFPIRLENRSHGYVEQEKGAEVMGPRRNVIGIPLSIIPAGRRAKSTVLADEKPGSRTNPVVLDPESSESSDSEDENDIDLLPDIDDGFGDDFGDPSKAGKRRRRESGESSTETSIPSKRSTPRYRSETPRDDPKPSHSAPICPVTDFHPGTLDLTSLPKLPEPTWAASSHGALQRLTRDIKELQKIQSSTPLATLGWYIDFGSLNNVFHWIVELHSFDQALPLARDMTKASCTSIVLELRFGSTYPISPPFGRVVRPQFVPFLRGGGGHITAGGAVCSELLTNSGWSPALSLEKVFLEVRLNLTEPDPPARLEKAGTGDYRVGEAVSAYRRAAAAHGWAVSSDLNHIVGL